MKIKTLLYFAKKYLTAKWSLMSTLSILMISFGVITLIAVLSIMNGFHNTFRTKILETNTYHIIIQPSLSDQFSLTNIKSVLKKNKDIISVIPYFDGEGIIKSRWSTRGIIIKAFPEDVLQQDSGFKNEIKVPKGEFDLSEDDHILLGEELAREMGVFVGDFVSVLTFRGEDISFSQPAFKVFEVVGYFKTGYWEYDKNMAYISINTAYGLFGIEKKDLAIGVKINNISRVDKVVNWMKNNGLDNLYILTWVDMNRVLFEALQNEKVGIGFVVMLIIVSGAFNIIGSLVMTVMEKRKEIGILRALGAIPADITRIFVIDGFYIGILGSATGVFVGFFLTLNIEKIFSIFESIVNGIKNLVYVLYLMPKNASPLPRFEILSDSIYYLEGVPVEIHFWDVFIISILSIFISIIAAYYPAKKASLTKPIDTIRYE
ncbi:MAG TPA: ABC transporter permease [Spirochaetes bacterium]|nr:ABC transporter permease [Spirochaetota bacterium]